MTLLIRGVFPEQRRNSLINHHSTMHSNPRLYPEHGHISVVWTTLVQQHRTIVNEVTRVWWRNNLCYLTDWRSLKCYCIEHGTYWLIYYYCSLSFCFIWCLIHRRFLLRHTPGFPLAFMHMLTLQKQRLQWTRKNTQLKCIWYLDRMEETDSTSC